MALVVEIVAGWCLLSVVAAFGLGPLLHGMRHLADRHEAPRAAADRSAA